MAGMSLTTVKHQVNLQQRRQSVLECKNSGLTVKQWCKQRGIDQSTYYRWQKEVWDREAQRLIPSDLTEPGDSPVRLVQLSVPPYMNEQSDNAGIIVRNAGWTVEIKGNADSILLDQVLRVVAAHG